MDMKRQLCNLTKNLMDTIIDISITKQLSDHEV